MGWCFVIQSGIDYFTLSTKYGFFRSFNEQIFFCVSCVDFVHYRS